jgi:Undecaprenyl-phosphate galactose phosphotransferase WbaP
MLGTVKSTAEARLPNSTLADFRATPSRVIGNAIGSLIGDAIALYLASRAVLAMRGLLLGSAQGPWNEGWVWVWMALWLAVSVADGLHPGYGLDLTEQMRRTVRVAAATSLFGLATIVIAPKANEFSRLLLLAGSIAAIPFTLMMRRIAVLVMLRLNRWGIPVLIVGDSDTARELTRTLSAMSSLGYRPTRYELEQLQWGSSNNPNDTGWTSTSGSIAFLADPHMPYRQREAIIAGPLAAFRRVFLAVDTPALDIGWAHARYLGAVRVLELRRLHLDPAELRVKRVIDLMLAGIVLVPFTLLMVFLAVLIKLDSPGPVFYIDQRLGLRGKKFGCIKFRTMRLNAEEYLKELLEKDAKLREEYTTFHKLKNDPRVTRIGQLLRKTSLDELPQVLNVLLGHMSLVGPRPYLPREQQYMHPYTEAVLSCRPGITGWWQVEARNRAKFDERVQMDIFYIRRWSIWLDLNILIRTVMVVLQARAY